MKTEVEATERSRPYSSYTMGGKRFKPPKEEENILRLPSHIALEILSRLPVKTIIHCSSVCKAWRALLLDPCFPTLHLAKSPVNLLLYNKGPSPRYWLIEFEEDFRKRKMSKFKNECLVLAGGGDGSEFQSVVGSCNGLICLSAFIQENGEQYCVWNPVKNDNVILPKPNLKGKDKYFVSRASAFGFCPRTNVYKVIRMVGDSGVASRNETMCEVYTLGTNASWRTIQHVPRPNSEFSMIPSVNGAVHWFIDKDVHIRVCAFRIDDEKWDPILLPLPLVGSARLRYHTDLGVVENCLAILDTSQHICFDIWMMEDYGVKDSWTKCWSIQTQILPEKRDPYFLPLKLTEDGNLLMYDKSNQALVCFNPRTGLITRQQKIYGLRSHCCLFRYAGPYVASFISPTQVVMKDRLN